MGFDCGSDLIVGLAADVDGCGSSNSGLRCNSLLSNLGGWTFILITSFTNDLS